MAEKGYTQEIISLTSLEVHETLDTAQKKHEDVTIAWKRSGRE